MNMGGWAAPGWLPGAHLQTIYPAVLAPTPRVAYRRERWITPDDDFVDVDFTDPAPDDPRHLVVLFHGLEGCSGSHYARGLMQAAGEAGWLGAVVNFRGCSGEINRAPRAYHSGDSAEIAWALARLADRYPAVQRHAVGVSLGGNALLKWAGEAGESGQRLVQSLAAISPPQDLQAGAVALSSGFNLVYMRHFLQTLRRKSLQKLEQYPGLFDRDRLMAARNFFDFDDAVTAPMHGFAGCHDYWTRSSCKPLLADVRVRTLVVNALNDPFLPAHHLASAAQVSSTVTLCYPDTGGHVGFLGSAFPGSMLGFGQRLLKWLA
ncbi:MAG: alpha/beta fold hydrolase [Burkholderiaceae bacterium]